MTGIVRMLSHERERERESERDKRLKEVEVVSRETYPTRSTDSHSQHVQRHALQRLQQLDLVLVRVVVHLCAE